MILPLFTGILQNLDSGLWTGPWTGLWTGLVTTITNQLACVQATLGADRAYTPGMVNGQSSESDSTYVYQQ